MSRSFSQDFVDTNYALIILRENQVFLGLQIKATKVFSSIGTLSNPNKQIECILVILICTYKKFTFYIGILK